MRERAVRSVQEGESPEVVARVIGVNRSTVYGWLRDGMPVEQFDQLGEVRERAGQAVDLVDHDNIDPAIPDVRQQPLQGGTLS
jgi:transposase-like protein